MKAWQNVLCWIKDTYSFQARFHQRFYSTALYSPALIISLSEILDKRKITKHTLEEGKKQEQNQKNKYLVMPKIFSPIRPLFLI